MNPERYREKEPDIKKAVERGGQYLESEHQNGYFPSYISSSRDMIHPKISPRENFSTIMITGTILKDNPDNKATIAALQYIGQRRQQGQFTFFEDRSVYPPDTDTNALGYSVLLETRCVSEQDAHQVLDTILSYRDKNGLVQVWLSKDRPNRIDTVVGANALYLAHLLGRGNETVQTENWLIQTLDSSAYLGGSRYYQSPDSFLHFMGRLTMFPELAEKMKAKLAVHLQQRIGKTGYPLDLAMRITLAEQLRMDNEGEKQNLLKLQEQGGSWPFDALFHYGNQQGYFGSKALTTAFSMKALKSVDF